MVRAVFHSSYLVRELIYRWARTLFVVGGVALAVSMVVLLPVLGQGFHSLAQLPFKGLDADLVVQQGPTESALPETMGLMLPYSAQPIPHNRWSNMGEISGVTAIMGSVLLWHFAPGKFFSVSGVPLNAKTEAIGPGRVGEWLIKGRMPAEGAHEAVVERHYGAFYRLKPGTQIDIGSAQFTITGVVDIQQGSQIAASNFYIDINEARDLVDMEKGSVNQLFLRVSDPSRADSAKATVMKQLPRASVVSADSFLTLLGTLSRLTGQFQRVTVTVGSLLALLLLIVFLRGAVGERQREAAILRAIGWSSGQARRQLAVETTLQGAIGGLLGLVLTWLATLGISTLTFTLPNGLDRSDDPSAYLDSQFSAPAIEATLPLEIAPLVWVITPLAVAIVCALLGWWLAGQRLRGTPWSRLRA